MIIELIRCDDNICKLLVNGIEVPTNEIKRIMYLTRLRSEHINMSYNKKR